MVNAAQSRMESGSRPVREGVERGGCQTPRGAVARRADRDTANRVVDAQPGGARVESQAGVGCPAGRTWDVARTGGHGAVERPAQRAAPRADPRRRRGRADRRWAPLKPATKFRRSSRIPSGAGHRPAHDQRGDGPRPSRAAPELRGLYHTRRPPFPDRPDPGRPDLLGRRHGPGGDPPPPHQRISR